MSADASLARLLDRALDAMNHAVLITARTGSSATGMEYIADWLNGHDACDEEMLPEILAAGTFPPEAES